MGVVLTRPSQVGCRERGISLIEVLISSLILLALAVGILPMFLRAQVNNQRGAQGTKVSTFAKDRLEGLYQLPFGSGPLAIPVASPEAETSETWTSGDRREGDVAEGWEAEPGSIGLPLWTRVTRVRQYGARDLEASLPGGTEDPFVHLKELEVRLESASRGGPLGAGQQLTVRVWKAF